MLARTDGMGTYMPHDNVRNHHQHQQPAMTDTHTDFCTTYSSALAVCSPFRPPLRTKLHGQRLDCLAEEDRARFCRLARVLFWCSGVSIRARTEDLEGVRTGRVGSGLGTTDDVVDVLEEC